MKRTRVYFLMPKIIMGGVEKVLLQLIAELKKDKSIYVKVVSKQNIEPYFIEFLANNNIDTVRDIYMTKPKKFWPKVLYKILNPINKIIAPIRLRRILKTADVLIDFHNAGFAKDIKKLTNKKITWCHGSIDYFNNGKSDFIDCLKYYDKLVCISESFRQDFVKQHPKYADKIIHIYNPIDYKNIEKQAKNIPSPTQRYLLSVSRLGYDKDIETIISAFKIFYKTNPDGLLLVVGSGPKHELLQQMASDCPGIEFLGQINEPYALIKNAVAHILSSPSEGLPNTLLETATLKTLSISSNCKSGPPEILMHGDAGLLFDVGNTKQLAKIMDDVWNSRVPADKMIQNGFDNIHRFSADKNAKKIADLIKSIV